MRFKPQRGSLEEANKLTKNVSSIKDIRKILGDSFVTLCPDEVQITFSVLDVNRMKNKDRWETHYVLMDGKAVGYSDGVLET